MGIDDADLSANFPTKSGGRDVEMSLCFWMKPRSFAYEATVISKYLTTGQARSWRLNLAGPVQGYLRLALGIGSGNNFKQYDFNGASQKLSKDRWYHVAFTYREKDRQIRVRVWDDAAGKLVFDSIDIATSSIAITRAPVILGAAATLSEYYDGLLDEMVVFNGVLTTEEIDRIREGRFGVTK
jgi:hypothetical protein